MKKKNWISIQKKVAAVSITEGCTLDLMGGTASPTIPIWNTRLECGHGGGWLTKPIEVGDLTECFPCSKVATKAAKS